ncbi:MAG: hypothetical protein KBC73_07775 [Burkholderiaceae bacterium]|nr:hypothetical protein [Burkholderiaceae bacterium]
MKLAWHDDARALLDAVEAVIAPHRNAVLDGGQRHAAAPALEAALEQGGYFETLVTDGLGPVPAAAMLMALAGVPAALEIGASALLAPRLGLPRPCAVITGNDVQAPVRFLPQARCVLWIADSGVQQALLQPGDVQPVDSLFAYPMGRLAAARPLAWQRAGMEAGEALDLWRLALAAEIAGNLAAALDSVVGHVGQRRQFGRPLGAFQAVQHRLAQCATTLEGLRWLVLAAAAGQLPAALAAAQAQQAVRPVCYDLHQFMGAMGLTLEHPLHRFSYRAKRLQSELGGAGRQFIAAARATWPAQPSRTPA